MALVFFLEGGEAASSADDSPRAEGGSPELSELRRELDLTRARLQTSREEFELTTEELRAANEELESINEEYRSTAEELETSKEELQSINEELQTVNVELKQKFESVARAHADLQNLITATDVGTLFLDSGLRIRRFTPRIADLFNITASDEGRPITDFTHRLEYHELADDARTVLSDLAPIEQEVRSDDGRWYLVRLRPYRTAEDRIDGVVATFVDITKRREAEEALRDSQTRLHLATEATGLGIYDYDPAAHVLWLDRRSRLLLGFTADEPVGLEDLRRRVHTDDVTAVSGAFEAALEAAAGDTYAVEFRLAGKPDGQRWVRAQGKVFQPGAAGVFRATRLVGTVRDITERKQTEGRQRLLLQELSHRVKNTLAVVQSLVRQTMRSTGNAVELVKRVEGRLRALAVAHDILVESDWKGADLVTLAHRQLDGLVDDTSRVEFAGPPITLPENLATPIGLVLHELATNAIKHGALSNEKGRVRLAWDVILREQKSILDLQWEEWDGPAIEQPIASGFGTKILEQIIPGAVVRHEFRRQGLFWRMRVPVSGLREQRSRSMPALEDGHG